MTYSKFSRAVVRTVPLAMASCNVPTASDAHEAWLLTPAEIAALAQEPMPALFASSLSLGLATAVGCAVVAVALMAERFIRPVEANIGPQLQAWATQFGAAFLRLAVAIMLILAGSGGLPRHGTAPWVQPTLFVPDMQLSLVPGWDWLAALQIGLGLLLMVGLFTRLVAGIIGVLSLVGLMIFEVAFMSYAPHFIAPALVLIVIGAGPLSVDHMLGQAALFSPSADLQHRLWRSSMVMVGAGFVYLALAHKLTQPTLLIAILQHGDFPSFGLSYALIALVMTGVEIICGMLLIFGRLTRPVSLVIVGAITFLAVTLGETPLFHANLYGVMLLFALAGPCWVPHADMATATRRVLA